ncbi:hypothetical protein [Herbiconiux daphne]|uniref:Uncharacterized protein n=1 Tax=Herbiconiux daphne TaxID=2970914 RepID=A0ABT2HC96_9MICO|nr:hypothetical protein [Herbiconiux daphne]MCS5737571.1 hypothetical protein [Herbiconiux daphne]
MSKESWAVVVDYTKDDGERAVLEYHFNSRAKARPVLQTAKRQFGKDNVGMYMVKEVRLEDHFCKFYNPRR